MQSEAAEVLKRKRGSRRNWAHNPKTQFAFFKKNEEVLNSAWEIRKSLQNRW